MTYILYAISNIKNLQVKRPADPDHRNYQQFIKIMYRYIVLNILIYLEWWTIVSNCWQMQERPTNKEDEETVIPDIKCFRWGNLKSICYHSLVTIFEHLQILAYHTCTIRTHWLIYNINSDFGVFSIHLSCKIIKYHVPCEHIYRCNNSHHFIKYRIKYNIKTQ